MEMEAPFDGLLTWAVFLSSLTDDVTSEIAEDDWPEAVYMRHPRLDHANYELH